jgi:type IV secretion system protein VirB10
MALSEDDDDDEVLEPVPLWKRGKVQVAAAIGFVALAFIFTHGKPPPKPDKGSDASDTFIGAVVPYQPAKAEPAPAPTPAPTPPPPVRAVAAAPPPPPPAAQVPVPVPLPMPKFAAFPTPKTPVRPVMMSFAVPHTDAPKTVAPAEDPQTGLAFKPATIPGTKASPAIDSTYMLMPGLLPLVLDTAIQSDLPGPLLAHLPGPVYSPKGVLLMPAGTQVIGRYESLGKSGTNRLMAVSTYAHTPDGIWVPLSGEPMADDLGRTGLDGAVDNHYLQRFGAAILLTIGESATSILQAAVSQGGNTYLQLNSGGGVGGLAQQILQQQSNIQPTFSKHQGETIALFLDEPIDFSSSYRIRPAAGN